MIVLTFGKYKGVKCIDVLVKDPRYLKWVLETVVIKDTRLKEYLESKRSIIEELCTTKSFARYHEICGNLRLEQMGLCTLGSNDEI